MTRFLAILACALAAPSAPAGPSGSAPSFDRALRAVNAIPTARSLAAWHELLATEPHVAGMPGDAREIERIRAAFVSMGLSTTVEEFDALLPQPHAATTGLIGLGHGGPGLDNHASRREVRTLDSTPPAPGTN